MNLDTIEEALKVKIVAQLRPLMNKLRESKVSKKDFTNLHNGIDLVQLAQDHIRYVAFWLFKERVSGQNVKCPNLRRLLEILCMLYGLDQL